MNRVRNMLLHPRRFWCTIGAHFVSFYFVSQHVMFITLASDSNILYIGHLQICHKILTHRTQNLVRGIKP